MAKKVNPWAVCHASTGPKTGSKFERCVMKVKKKQGIDEMNTLDLMANKIVESIELLQYQDMYEEVLEEAVEFLLAQENLTIESVREGIDRKDIRVDEALPLLMLGARLAAPYVMRAIASRVGGNLAGRAAGWAGGQLMKRGGQRLAAKLFGKQAGRITDLAGKVVKGGIKDTVRNGRNKPESRQEQPQDPIEKKKDAIDKLPSSNKMEDELEESIQLTYLQEGFMSWMGDKIKRGAKWAGKQLLSTGINTVADMTKSVPFIGGLAQMARGAKDSWMDASERKAKIEKRKKDQAAAQQAADSAAKKQALRQKIKDVIKNNKNKNNQSTQNDKPTWGY